MPVDEFHRRIAMVALEVAERHGFALGGGNALIAHGIVDRVTDAGRRLDHLNDAEFARYGLGPGPRDIVALRARLADWPRP